MAGLHFRTGLRLTGTPGGQIYWQESDVTGAPATGAVGTITTRQAQTITVSSVSSTGAIGGVNFNLDVGRNPPANVATVAAGTPTVDTTSGTSAPITGEPATGAAGEFTISGTASLSLTGLETVGTARAFEAVYGGSGFQIEGVGATGTAGSATTGQGVLFEIVGIPATGYANGFDCTDRMVRRRHYITAYVNLWTE